MELIKVTPNREKAKSMLRMVEITLKMIDNINVAEFPSNVTKEYYDVIRELLAIIALLDGYKAYGEGAHKTLIEYLEKNYREFGSHEIATMDELRNIRNKISYDGFFVEKDYISRRIASLKKIIAKLKRIIQNRLSQN